MKVFREVKNKIHSDLENINKFILRTEKLPWNLKFCVTTYSILLSVGLESIDALTHVKKYITLDLSLKCFLLCLMLIKNK